MIVLRALYMLTSPAPYQSSAPGEPRSSASAISFSATFSALQLGFSDQTLAAAPETAEDKETKTKAYWQTQIDWLTERFPDGEYRDVIGLCKAAKLDGEDGIIDQDYSLNAGRYVGVVIEDDGMTEAEFKETMLGLNAEFESLNEEAKKLEEEIAGNIKALFEV